jgi:hypothetical protein
LLVLGIVRGYGQVHGYPVGADLLSWGAGEWVNVDSRVDLPDRPTPPPPR